ncbi:hypothetical protein DYU05_14320 [Mucilaginibacter terrenus]|uniref:DUF4292 domain-containing protein n=1 Tax=Mucilaginibacter terrenus TaxID=2482727 RepID=A0A3E2NQN3_9SPHI|nr:hypothetical protein [Mucilaginibacter terrenus]RFZ83306.1 hypothetical protein DYU05_14320 [Mucilaginibacter terrenus]
MRNTALLLLAAIILASCGGGKAPSSTNGAISTPSLKAKLSSVYQGVWIKSDYIDKVARTKSVLASVDLVTGMSGINIDTNLLRGDSMLVNVSWDNHNNGEVSLKFYPGKKPNTLQFGEDELGYSIVNGDTTLLLYQVYKGVLYKTPYRKVFETSPEENLSYAINYAINKALLTGDYLLKTGEKNEKVTFTPEGKVVGLPGVKSFQVDTDMKYGTMQNVDQLTFDSFTSHEQTFAYVIKDNTLSLFEVKPNSKQTLLTMGKLKYSLVRAK